MPLAKQDVRAVVDVYIQAWETQNPDLITTIFTASATYHERVLEEKIRDRDGIRSYWETKVVASQANISCKPLAIYLDGDTAIVEWEAHFDDLETASRKRMREVAILEFQGHLIASIREYWASEDIDTLAR
ncbi:MAG TPA: nuclear transport factor 2 family protein [Pseudonocardiaceae bacterium]